MQPGADLYPRLAVSGGRYSAMGGGVPLTSEGQVIAGFWHTEQIERLTGRGLAVLIAPDAGKRKGARPGWNGGLYAFMRRRPWLIWPQDG